MVHDLEELANMSDSSRALMSPLPDWSAIPQSVRQRGLSARYVATAIAALGVAGVRGRGGHRPLRVLARRAGARVTETMVDLNGREPRSLADGPPFGVIGDLTRMLQTSIGVGSSPRAVLDPRAGWRRFGRSPGCFPRFPPAASQRSRCLPTSCARPTATS